MHPVIVIALGGAIGAVTRYGVATGIHSYFGREFPLATLVINVSGCFLMGLLSELLMQRLLFASELRAMLLTGFLGAYTTFSTFALETLYLYTDSSPLKAWLNIVLSVILCLTACWLGLICGRSIDSENAVGWSIATPYLKLLIGSLIAVSLSALFQFLCLRFNLNQDVRLVVYIVLPALLTILGAYSLAQLNNSAELSLLHLLGLFIINALGSAGLVAVGIGVGESLWRLKLSP